MALAAIPDEVNRHIEAVVVLSKRDVLLKILTEADLCLERENLPAAAVLAGVALEQTCILVGPDRIDKHKHDVEIWRQLKGIMHQPASLERLRAADVRALLVVARALLQQLDEPNNEAMQRPSHEAIAKVRGKYAFVKTSVDEFLKRKRDESELE